LKVYSIVSGSALIASALLTCSLIFPSRTISAETVPAQTQQQATPAISFKGNLGEKIAAEEVYVVPPTSYVATAYSLRGRTASGRPVAKGLIAADPRHLPLGSRVRLDAGTYSGEYLVADTGSMVRGRRIDIWTPTSREAMRFGRRTVKLTVLSLGGRRAVDKR
jgi:3D (Asp-Asp-Asp) domain-containing protein